MNRATGRAARLRQIENMLFNNPAGIRIVDIATACQVNRRTVYRDIDLLTAAGVPIWEDNSRYGIIREQYLATIRLTLNEATALYIAARLLARHAHEHNPYIVSALSKLATAFPDPLAQYILRTAQTIRDRPLNPHFVQILETLTLAWLTNRKVKLWYRSPNAAAPTERTLSPYTLEPSIPGALYIIGHDERTREIRTFKLDRIEQARILDDSYQIPQNFDPKTHLADAWGIMTGNQPVPVLLRFSPNVSTIIQERIWHPSQTITEHPDGSLDLHLEIADIREMRPWIRSWGGEVEVIRPETLRTDMIAEAQQLATLYKISLP